MKPLSRHKNLHRYQNQLGNKHYRATSIEICEKYDFGGDDVHTDHTETGAVCLVGRTLKFQNGQVGRVHGGSNFGKEHAAP